MWNGPGGASSGPSCVAGGRAAALVKLAPFLDKQSSRRLSLQPDYCGFRVDESFVVVYGLGSPEMGRNLPYVTPRAPAGTPSKG